MIKPAQAKYWEFPSADVPHGEQHRLVLREVQSLAGLLGQIDPGGPLDQFDWTRGGQTHSVIALLMHVSSSDGKWLQASAQRRRWCQAEEARAWIRRKPLRRLIDLALRRLKDRQPEPPGV